MKKYTFAAVAALVLTAVPALAVELDAMSNPTSHQVVSLSNNHYADDCTYSPVLFMFQSAKFPVAQAYLRTVGTSDWHSTPFRITHDGRDEYRVEIQPGTRTIRANSSCPSYEVKLVK